MLDKETYIVDIETDNLLDDISKIHCLSLYNTTTHRVTSYSKYEDMTEWLFNDNMTIIGHNFIRFDRLALEKILNIEIKCDIIDTLPLSWVLDEKRRHHNLESYGTEFSTPKIEIKDWKNLSTEEYILRCETDVRINFKLWKRQIRHLKTIYEDDEKNLIRYFKYLRFKMECVADQEQLGLKLDVDKAKLHFDELSLLKVEKTEELESVMPKVVVKKKVYENAYEEDGNIIQKGDLFFDGSKSISTIEIVTKWEEPNSNSHVQIKKWLYLLGWEPQNILHKRNKKTGEIKQIPQIKSQFEEGEVCDSIKLLFEKEPKLEVLSGLSVLTHRIGIFEGFLRDNKEGRIYPSMNGLTNTLRLQHRVIANLPRAYRKYGEEIRACLITDNKNTLLCCSDLAGIEDRTKRHFIYKYDPAYVERMSAKDYDPHTTIAVLANMMTKEDEEFYKWYKAQKEIEGWIPLEKDKERFKELDAVRYKAKTTNFAATYKVGAPTLSCYPGINLGLREAQKLLRVYWELNSSILKVERSLEVKELYGQKWLFNPISRFWYSLRADKDKFSTLNQGTAVYIFDKWITNIRKQGIKIPFQYHDEIVFNVKKTDIDSVKGIIEKAIEELNNNLKLNVELGCSVEWGLKYSEIH